MKTSSNLESPQASPSLAFSARDFLPPYLQDNYSLIISRLAPSDKPSFDVCLDFAIQAHTGQKRVSGEDYITHPLAVAEIISEISSDIEVIQAALLHDVVEDTDYSLAGIENKFGTRVATLVEGVTKLGDIDKKFPPHTRQALEFHKLILAMAKDINVIVVKIADRLHNMRTIRFMPKHKQKSKADETERIFVPLAMRVGLNIIANELDNICFSCLYPLRHSMLEKAISKANSSRKNFLDTIHNKIEESLQESKIPFSIQSRVKTPASVYKKMKLRKNNAKFASFYNVLDVHGFRIITKSLDDCYAVLGKLHNLFKPYPGYFKDYIALPKQNGYQSIHTTLVGYGNFPIEVQIRSEDMNKVAENGIAAHSRYKLPESQLIFDTKKWANSWKELEDPDEDNSLEYMEIAEAGLQADEIYVFSPDYEIYRLPIGASVLDFAFAVHSKVGMKAVSAEVNNTPVSLSRKLVSGDFVKILTHASSNPHPSWLSVVVTARAHSYIRAALRRMKTSSINLFGSQFLQMSIAALDPATQKLLLSTDPKDLIENYCRLKNTSKDQVLSQLASAEIAPIQVIQAGIHADLGTSSKHKQSIFTVGAQEQRVVYSSCCSPLPGDRIFGHFSKLKGITIHRQRCSNTEHFNNIFEASWQEQINQDFIARIECAIENKSFFSQAMASFLEQAMSIRDIKTKESSIHHLHFRFKVEVLVKDKNHLEKQIARLLRKNFFKEIVRVIG